MGFSCYKLNCQVSFLDSIQYTSDLQSTKTFLSVEKIVKINIMEKVHAATMKSNALKIIKSYKKMKKEKFVNN